MITKNSLSEDGVAVPKRRRAAVEEEEEEDETDNSNSNNLNNHNSNNDDDNEHGDIQVGEGHDGGNRVFSVRHDSEVVNSSLPPALPLSFVEFLRTNDIDPSVYRLVGDLPRFVRVNRRNPPTEDDMRRDLGTALVGKVDWLTGFYELGSDAIIAKTNCYREGKICGMDISSAVAVMALQIRPGEHVLDLCAAPGAKTCMIADYIGEQGSVTGVDISSERIASCRSLLRKYKVSRSRLYLADGTTFNISAPTGAPDKANLHGRKRSRSKKSRTDAPTGSDSKLPFYSSRDMVAVESCEGGDLYDKVIVDAECTHEGSMRHIWKYKQWGWDTFESRFLNPERLNNLQTLQRNLISNGFRLLKPGGLMVYSTCSFSKRQNEDIVSYLTEKETTAHPERVDDVIDVERAGAVRLLDGCALRFEPHKSRTSGLFLACIRKSSIDL